MTWPYKDPCSTAPGTETFTVEVERLRLASLPGVAAIYLPSYVALDWLSYIQPFNSFGITPWNPHTGVTFALALLLGKPVFPLLFVAPLLADIIVRGLSTPLPVAILLSFVVGTGYSLAALVLFNPRFRFQTGLNHLQEVCVLLFVAAVSTALVAALYVVVLISASLLTWADFLVAAQRLWVGDLIGVVIVTPCILLFAAKRWPPLNWEALAQCAALCLALWMIFFESPTPQLYRFYLLFLPIVWISLRGGLPGACVGLFVAQLSLVFVIEFLIPNTVNTTIYQEMMLILALTGLSVGCAVMERQQAEHSLRLQQDAHARLTRLGSINELAATMAHEINQPLSAAATYTRLLAEELGENGFSITEARRSADKANAQVHRAATVIRKLRDLIQTGRIEKSPVLVADVFESVLAVMAPELRRAGVSVATRIEPRSAVIIVDVLQIEQVLINLLRNACDAIESAGHGGGQATFSAIRTSENDLEIVVGDSGPGFQAEQLRSPFIPFNTTKAGGLGIGLSLCRSIIERHDGRIWLQNGPVGAEVHFTLTCSGADSDEEVSR